jgi:ferric-dicitrate binding protein FerR (iron transport regulator)
VLVAAPTPRGLEGSWGSVEGEAAVAWCEGCVVVVQRPLALGWWCRTTAAPIPPPRPHQRGRRRYWLVLGLCLGVVVVAALALGG